ncbi:hypothetical protein QCA50_017810 [Cerrena zonata]|uniref:Uncharacterized protein n=1 Tax=Cerrena zonata TaxID=2478898 RepID=A0AAW0FIR2_9APHY
MSSSAASTSTAVPQPENLFTGRLDYHMAAAVVYRVNRIGRALSSLVAGDVGNDKRRRRWRIGLYYEFTILKRAIGDLMVSGCQGGPFFSVMQFPWLEKHSEDAFIINWSTIEPLSRQIPLYPWIFRHIAPELLSENEWWKYHAQMQTPNISRPPWWDCDEAAVPQYIPQKLVTVSHLEETKTLLRSSRHMMEEMQVMVAQGFPRDVTQPNFG